MAHNETTQERNTLWLRHSIRLTAPSPSRTCSSPSARAEGAEAVYSASMIFNPAQQKTPQFKALQDACITVAREKCGERLDLKEVRMPFRDAGEKAVQRLRGRARLHQPVDQEQARHRQRPAAGRPSAGGGVGRPAGALQHHALRLDEFRQEGRVVRPQSRPDRQHRHAAHRRPRVGRQIVRRRPRRRERRRSVLNGWKQPCLDEAAPFPEGRGDPVTKNAPPLATRVATLGIITQIPAAGHLRLSDLLRDLFRPHRHRAGHGADQHKTTE